MVGFAGFLILAVAGGGLALFFGVPPVWIGGYVIGLILLGALTGFSSGSNNNGNEGGGGSGGSGGSSSGGFLSNAADAANGFMNGLGGSGGSDPVTSVQDRYTDRPVDRVIEESDISDGSSPTPTDTTGSGGSGTGSDNGPLNTEPDSSPDNNNLNGDGHNNRMVDTRDLEEGLGEAISAIEKDYERGMDEEEKRKKAAEDLKEALKDIKESERLTEIVVEINDINFDQPPMQVVKQINNLMSNVRGFSANNSEELLSNELERIKEIEQDITEAYELLQSVEQEEKQDIEDEEREEAELKEIFQHIKKLQQASAQAQQALNGPGGSER